METGVIIFEFALGAALMAAPLAFPIPKKWARFVFFFCGLFAVIFGAWQIYNVSFHAKAMATNPTPVSDKSGCTFIETKGTNSRIKVNGGYMQGCDALKDTGTGSQVEFNNVPISK